MFRRIEDELIASFIKNLARHRKEEEKYGFHWTAWQAEKLKALQSYRLRNEKILGKYQETIEEETRTLLQNQYEEGYRKEAQEAQNAGVFHEAPPGSFFGVNAQRTDALIQDMLGSERRAQTAALRMMDDVYRRGVHQAAVAMSTGTVTLPNAIDMATKGFLRSGINCIVYQDGRRVPISEYVEMALRTAATRTQLQGGADKRRELGVDTVLVSQHNGTCEMCLPYQGKVFIDDVWGDYDGDRDGTFGISKNGKQYMLLSVAVEGGLFHPQCRHGLSTWYEGISTLPDPIDEDTALRVTALIQKQRRMERNIRRMKRLRDNLQNNELKKIYHQQVKEAQDKLVDFLDEHKGTLNRAGWRERTFAVPLPRQEMYDMLVSQIQGIVHVPPLKKYCEIADQLTVDIDHIVDRGHNVTVEEAQTFVKNARMTVTVWGGAYERYYGDQGSSYVYTKTGLIRTAFKEEEYQDDIKYALEVAKELEQWTEEGT